MDYVLVGGPHDGKWVDAPFLNTLRMPRPRPLAIESWLLSGRQPIREPDFTCDDYRLEHARRFECGGNLGFVQYTVMRWQGENPL